MLLILVAVLCAAVPTLFLVAAAARLRREREEYLANLRTLSGQTDQLLAQVKKERPHNG